MSMKEFFLWVMQENMHILCSHQLTGKIINQVILSVSGIVVSIAAFQAVDPGLTPGHRKCFVYLLKHFITKFTTFRLYILSLH